MTYGIDTNGLWIFLSKHCWVTLTQHAHIYRFPTSNFNFGQFFFFINTALALCTKLIGKGVALISLMTSRTVEFCRRQGTSLYKTWWCGYGASASLGGSLCNTSKMYAQRVRLLVTSQKLHKKHKQHDKQHHHGVRAARRLQRRGFDEPMPPEGWAALRMFVPRPRSKRFNRFNKLK